LTFFGFNQGQAVFTIALVSKKAATRSPISNTTQLLADEVIE